MIILDLAVSKYPSMLSDGISGLKTINIILKQEIANINNSVDSPDLAHVNSQLNYLMETVRISQIIIRQNVDNLTRELFDHLHYLNLEQKQIILNDLGNL
jgi:hypothetical protein